MKVETGVMVVKNGKGWGKAYDDAKSTEFGWVPLEVAQIYDRLLKPTDVTYAGSPYVGKLKDAKVVKVERITTVKVESIDNGKIP